MPCLLLAYCVPTPPLGSTRWTHQPVRVGGTYVVICTKPWVDELSVTGTHTAGLLLLAAETGTRGGFRRACSAGMMLCYGMVMLFGKASWRSQQLP